MIKDLYRFFSSRFQNVFLDYPVDNKPRYGHGKSPHNELYQLINNNRSVYEKWLSRAIENREVFYNIKDSSEEKDKTKPTWNNGFLPGLDIVMIYTVLTSIRPKKYIEVGSGNSTKVAYYSRTIEDLNMEIVSIDPMPRAEIDDLADKVIRAPFEETNLDELLKLEQGDVLFIDNSHRILPNSDATVFFLEVLPKLKTGVIVHIHDIYLPYDYPQIMCDRYYSEQYGLAMYLLANSIKYKPIIPNYFISEDKELSEKMDQFWNHPNLKNVERHGGSFWIEIGE